MPPIFSYNTLHQLSEGNYHESGSKFLAYAFPAENREQFEAQYNQVKALHPKARHHCYAYRILEREEITDFASDAGEPSGSAGQPILGELRRNHLVNVAVIVVRYFGGTKLGIPGLIHAYRESTANAISANETILVTRTTQYAMDTPLALQPQFYSACKQCGIEIVDTSYDDRFHAQINIPLEFEKEKLNQLLSIMSGREGATELLAKWMGVKIMDDPPSSKDFGGRSE